MPTETKVWKAICGAGSSSKPENTTTINIDSLQLKIVNVGNDDNSGSEDSDDELGALIYNSSNTAKKCREEAIKDTVSIATSQAAEVGGNEKRTHDVSTFDDTMTSDVMDTRRLNDDNTSSIATNKLQQNYISNNNTDTVSTHHVEQKKKQRYANEEIVKQLLAERELKRMYDMKINKQQMKDVTVEEAVGIKSRDGQVSGGNKGDTNKNVQEVKTKKDTDDQSPPLVVDQIEQEKSSISEYVTVMNSIESMLSNRMKKEKGRMVALKSHEQSKEEDVQKSVIEAALPSTPPRDFDWVSYYRQHKSTSKVSSSTADKAKKQKKTVKEPPVIVTKQNYQKNYHNYQIKDAKVLKQISTVVIPQPRPTRPPQPQVNGRRDWQSQNHLLRHHTPTHRQRTPYSQRYHPPTLHHASPPPYRQKTMSTSQSTRVHKKSPHTSKYKIKRPPGRPKHGVSERKMLRGPPPVVHDGSPAWGRSKIDSRQDIVVDDTRDDTEEDPRVGSSSLVLDQRQKKQKKRRHIYDADGRRIIGQVAIAKAEVLAKQSKERREAVDGETEELKQTLKMDREAKAKVWNRYIDLERQNEDERYSMEAERLVKRVKQCEKGNKEEQVRRAKELLEMTDDIKNLGEEREREEEQIRYVQMLAVRELQRRKVIESKMNWM